MLRSPGALSHAFIAGEGSAVSTRCCSATEAPPVDSLFGGVSCSCCGSKPSLVPHKMIQLLSGGATVHDFYQVGKLLSICTIPKPVQQKPAQTQGQQPEQPLDDLSMRAATDWNRPLLYHAVTQDERREKKVLKVVKKKKGAVQSEADGAWRRMCTHMLNLPPHPNVLSFEAVLETSDAFIFASEHLEGGELFDFLLREKSIHEDVCQFITLQILRAVDHLHRHNLLHRDVKPENLMFRRRQGHDAATSPRYRQHWQHHKRRGQHKQDGAAMVCNEEEDAIPGPFTLSMEEQHELLLIDFDTSMFIHDPYANKVGEAGSSPRRLVGTYGYLAPEVLKAGHYSRASDLWSVGIILYILMTGAPPMPMEEMTSARSALNAIKRVVEDGGGIDFEAASLGEFPLARDLCRRLLEIDPEKRIQTAAHAMEHPWLDVVRNRPLRSSTTHSISPHTPTSASGQPPEGVFSCPRHRYLVVDADNVDSNGCPGTPEYTARQAGPEVPGASGGTEQAVYNQVHIHGEAAGHILHKLSFVAPGVLPEGKAAREGNRHALAVVAPAATATAATSSPHRTPTEVSSLESIRTSGAESSSNSSKTSGSNDAKISATLEELPSLISLKKDHGISRASMSCITADLGQHYYSGSFPTPEEAPGVSQGTRHNSGWSCATTVGGVIPGYSTSTSKGGVGGSFYSIGSPYNTPPFLSSAPAGGPHPGDICCSVSVSPACLFVEPESPLGAPLGPLGTESSRGRYRWPHFQRGGPEWAAAAGDDCSGASRSEANAQT
ncbi:serine/threonine-protein kinase ATG1 [Cyclospora cayetanensis]|uniref:Serine/threonine-protein kinase ATG1 n=1 Tax=Cyclospora cayetanensis TaxID=88456 RepID=A0A6P6RUU6_9EIME|nr:serine/threonine-protein kinase ATG1 [Cyclospora cayetanensis]